MKKVKNFILSCAFCVLMSYMGFAATQMPQGFRYTVPVIAQEEGTYTSVRLTPQIINKLNSDFSDLLFWSENQAVPYFIHGYSLSKSESTTEYEMVLSDAYVKDSFQYLDYKLSEESSDDIVATSLQMISLGQFSKEIALYGSYDGIHWDFVREDSIHQVDGSRKLFVELRPEEKYTWYRFRISGNQEPVTFEQVWLEYRVDVAAKNFFVETLSPDMEIRQEEKTTVVILSGLKNLEISEIEFETDSMFKRNVYVNGKPHELYNLTFGSENYRDLTINLDGYQCLSDELEIRIENGDDMPIQLSSVSLSYLAYDVIFQNTRNPIVLYFGNDEAEKPRYDIAAYKENILSQGYSKANIGEMIELPAETPDEADKTDYTTIFNVVIIVVAVSLAAVLLVRIKKIK